MANPENMCVGCESPLVRGQRYGVRRGQLWHSHCFIAFGGKTNREREIERRIASLEHRGQTEMVEHESTRTALREARSKALRHQSERDAEAIRRKTAERERDSLRRELAAVRDMNTMSRNDLDRVQRELAELQRAAAAPPSAPAAPAPTETTKKPDNDDYTGTEVRFSLLELD